MPSLVVSEMSIRFMERWRTVRILARQFAVNRVCRYFRAMSDAQAPAVTVRALVLGALLAFFLNLACPYSVLVLQNAGLTSDYITAGAMMVFVVLVGLVNPALKMLFRTWALRTGELVVVYAMMIVASAIPTWGLVTNLFHILTRPFYYATPENRWDELIQPLIPAWLAPRDPEVARYFYELSLIHI